MKRRRDQASGDRSWLSGDTWKEIGHDGGSEASAWHTELWRNEDSRLEQTRTRWTPPSQTVHAPTPLLRRCIDRLFKNGLMAPILLGGLMLSGLIAWLLGFR